MGVKIRVPESVGGEVTVTYANPAKGAVRYVVAAGAVDVAEEDVETFLRSVDGAEVADTSSRAKTDR